MIAAPAKPRRLISPGPIADKFGRSRAFIKIIIGPVGSGKTMKALECGLRVGAMQRGVLDPNTRILWRKARFGVIRESYPSLESTTLKSWFNIVPESEGNFGRKAPFTHTFRKILRREDGRPVDVLDMEYEFRAIGEQSVEEACRGWEVNAVMVDEADIQPDSLVPFLTGRVGRFSDLDPANVVDPQIICSLNMPDIDNHMYRLAMERELGGLEGSELEELKAFLGDRPLIESFIQPGGLEPDAENIHNLPGGRAYYLLQVAANKHKPGYVDRMVHNKPVPLQHGLPVNPKFIHSMHVREQIWDPGRLLVCGLDQGLFPAFIPTQRTVNGDLRTLGEVVNVGRDGKSLIKIGGRAFGEKCKQYLADRFPGIQPHQIRIVGDPAAFKADDNPDNERDWLRAFEKGIGLKVYKAKSNKAALRNEAIWQLHDRVGGYEVDPSAKMLIKGHVGGYRYQKQELGTGEVRGHLTIADTIYTNPCDAEQYAALEGENVILEIRGQTPRSAGSSIVNDSEYSILGDW